MPSSTRYQLNEPDVIQDIVHGEALIVHTRTGAYYSLMGSGIRIWEALLAGRTVHQIAELFLPHNGVGREGIQVEVGQFVATLLQDQLIRPGAREETDVSVLPPPSAFEAPVLQKFTDMQELLLVDPIHEVHPDAGWPRARDKA